MSEAKFTPGPWAILDRGDGSAEIETVSTGKLVEADLCLRGQFSIPDAHLIAAAPELYDALQACIDHGSMTGDEFVVDQAYAALAKARGEA